MSNAILDTIAFIRQLYQSQDFLPLHAPSFDEQELDLVTDTIKSTFVSSVGRYVSQFEQQLCHYTQAKGAVATVNGTAALHTALYLAGVKTGDLVISQALTFVATCNAITQLGATPLFIDVSRDRMSLCPEALARYLDEHAELTDEGLCRHRPTGRIIRAMVPMHTFGHPAELEKLLQLAGRWHIGLVEDAAESLGSWYRGQHTGTLGRFGTLSFNGNKIVTTGGGGMLLCASHEDAERAKHITTTAKQPHALEFFHDMPGFNYRMPNLNAALGCAQMTKLDGFVQSKRAVAEAYRRFFADTEFAFVCEPSDSRSNYWLNAIVLPDPALKQPFLQQTNQAGVMTRPVWQPMHTLPMFANAPRGELGNTEWLALRLINLPSSPLACSNT
ncbi:LegC family aminotransferase [Shewanella cyperi]|uniref:LegC family aminotransferase n=1 Tax=Shewanella cyperi TaxID=2814292 RepID=UPI001A948DE6|nr:LegC family aminotransferase [Shewanella cyperi]QSX39721.1 LegC family aminotransferase [Shewanella cyperi]